MNTRRWIVVGSVAVVVGLLAWAAFAVLGKGESITSSPLVGKPVPAVDLVDVNSGEPTHLATPGKVEIINFWAPWCVPCMAEHRMLNQATGQWPADKVAFVGIAFQSEDISAITNFLGTVGFNVPTLQDDSGKASIPFGVTGVPETFIVDQAGIVRAHVSGPISDKLLTTVVNRLLAGQSLAGITR